MHVGGGFALSDKVSKMAILWFEIPFDNLQEDLQMTTTLQQYLVIYVNRELALDPPLPSRGKALFDHCSDPTILWLVVHSVVEKLRHFLPLLYSKLINKSVPGTVDLRALSKVTGSASQRNEAIEENMTLVTESARAIGCRIDEFTQDKLIQKDPETVRNFLLDLIRVSLSVMAD